MERLVSSICAASRWQRTRLTIRWGYGVPLSSVGRTSYWSSSRGSSFTIVSSWEEEKKRSSSSAAVQKICVKLVGDKPSIGRLGVDQKPKPAGTREGFQSSTDPLDDGRYTALTGQCSSWPAFSPSSFSSIGSSFTVRCREDGSSLMSDEFRALELRLSIGHQPSTGDRHHAVRIRALFYRSTISSTVTNYNNENLKFLNLSIYVNTVKKKKQCIFLVVCSTLNV